MASEVFEIGLFKPQAAGNEAVMLPRVWDADTLLRSVAWLRHQNRDGRNIYVRPRGEHNLSLVDDLTRDPVVTMKRAGFSPAAVIETSPWRRNGFFVKCGPGSKPNMRRNRRRCSAEVRLVQRAAAQIEWAGDSASGSCTNDALREPTQPNTKTINLEGRREPQNAGKLLEYGEDGPGCLRRRRTASS
jgi:RepB DNA-primase N-terminal domain